MKRRKLFASPDSIRPVHKQQDGLPRASPQFVVLAAGFIGWHVPKSELSWQRHQAALPPISWTPNPWEVPLGKTVLGCGPDRGASLELGAWENELVGWLRE